MVRFEGARPGGHDGRAGFEIVELVALLAGLSLAALSCGDDAEPRAPEVTAPVERPEPPTPVAPTSAEKAPAIAAVAPDAGREQAASATKEPEAQLVVGEDSEAAASEERARKQKMKQEAKEILAALKRLRRSGKQMAGIRRKSESGDQAASAKCGELMRQYQGQARELRSRADEYENSLVFGTLSAACGSMEACVSCNSSFAEGGFCTNVDQTLKDAADWIGEL